MLRKFLLKNRLMGLSSWSRGGGGLANGSLMSLIAGKFLSLSGASGSVESVVDASRPSLNSRRASVHALLGPYIRLPSKNGVTSFSCKPDEQPNTVTVVGKISK